MTTYRIRPSVAVMTSATLPLFVAAAWILLGVVFDSPLTAEVGLLVAVFLFARNLVRVRRRSLTVTMDGLVVQRDAYRLTVPWSGVRAVQRRRHQRVMPAEELVVEGAQVEAVDRRGRATDVESQLEGHPATTRVMVGLYDRDWRDGPIGEHLRERGVL